LFHRHVNHFLSDIFLDCISCLVIVKQNKNNNNKRIETIVLKQGNKIHLDCKGDIWLRFVFLIVNIFYQFQQLYTVHFMLKKWTTQDYGLRGRFLHINRSPVWAGWCSPNRFWTQESTPLVVSELYPWKSSKCNNSKIRQGRVSVRCTALLINAIYQPTTFLVDISYGFRVMSRTLFKM
jgi:hypothetical protein